MNENILTFAKHYIKASEVKGKTIIELGSRNINGSIKPIIMDFKPLDYVGIDTKEGDNVNKVLSIEDAVNFFGIESFDFAICTEVLEHCKHIETVITSIKLLVRKTGIIFITARGFDNKGIPFKYHGYPKDYYRFTKQNIKNIFKDFKILKLENDDYTRGIMLKAKKPREYNFPINIRSEINKLYRIKCPYKEA